MARSTDELEQIISRQDREIAELRLRTRQLIGHLNESTFRINYFLHQLRQKDKT